MGSPEFLTIAAASLLHESRADEANAAVKLAPIAAQADTAVPIVVFQISPSVLGYGHGGLSIARSAGRMGIPVYGLYAEQGAPERLSRYWTGHFTRPTRDAGCEAWLESLAEIGRELGRAVLIPTDDAAGRRSGMGRGQLDAPPARRFQGTRRLA